MTDGEIVVVEPIDPMVLIRDFLQGPDRNPEALKTLFDLQREWFKDQAAAKYARAISRFQAECPPVVKTREVRNRDGTPRYHFAGYEDVMTTAAPFLAQNEIAVSISGPTKPDRFDLTIHIRVGTHVEHYPWETPYPDIKAISGANGVNEAQAVGLVHSYFKRYAVCAALGIKVIGEDTEARLLAAAEDESLSDEHCQELDNLFDSIPGMQGEKLMSWLSERYKREIAAFKDLRESEFAYVRDSLVKTAKKGGAS